MYGIIGSTLVTIYSPPGVNSISHTRVLPMAKDVPEGTVHISDGLDGLLAGQYVSEDPVSPEAKACMLTTGGARQARRAVAPDEAGCHARETSTLRCSLL